MTSTDFSRVKPEAMVGLVEPEACPSNRPFQTLSEISAIYKNQCDSSISHDNYNYCCYTILIKDKACKDEKSIDEYFSIMSLTFSPLCSVISSSGQDLRASQDYQRISCNPEAKNP